MVKIIVRGVVQGVGFRPTVYRVAKEMGLKGHVKNTGSDVEICLDGREKEFMEELRRMVAEHKAKEKKNDSVQRQAK